jgi:peptidoglycan-N-acetylmuramic acid deacetylase
MFSCVNAEEKKIALTIDDLPFVSSTDRSKNHFQREQDRFYKILQTLIDEEVPATGFVIGGTVTKEKLPWLESFEQNGFTLGNHTYSHLNLNSKNITAEQYIENIAKTDEILTKLKPTNKYFRYPYLAEGAGEKKQAVLNYLNENQYTVAPVTIDSKDFQFNEQLYRIPYRAREANLNSIKKRYLNYIWSQALRAEKHATPGQPVHQILLIHANMLNSYLLKDVITQFKEKGYVFVSLDEAMALNQKVEILGINKLILAAVKGG